MRGIILKWDTMDTDLRTEVQVFVPLILSSIIAGGSILVGLSPVI